MLAGRDLMAAAQTGTGKTAGFALPVLQRLALEGEKVASNSIRALVLVPTRELAEQVHNNVREYAENLPLSTYAVYGGVSINPQMMRLRRGVDLLVATLAACSTCSGRTRSSSTRCRPWCWTKPTACSTWALPKSCNRSMPRCHASARLCCFPPRSPSRSACWQGLALNDPLSIEVSPRNATAASVKQWLVPVDKSARKTCSAT